MATPKTTRPSEQFPVTKPWPVVPPDEHWFYRWHWLRDEEGRAFCTDWHYAVGWGDGVSGRFDPEDVEGWVYLEPAMPPAGERA